MVEVLTDVRVLDSDQKPLTQVDVDSFFDDVFGAFRAPQPERPEFKSRAMGKGVKLLIAPESQQGFLAKAIAEVYYNQDRNLALAGYEILLGTGALRNGQLHKKIQFDRNGPIAPIVPCRCNQHK